VDSKYPTLVIGYAGRSLRGRVRANGDSQLAGIIARRSTGAWRTRTVDGTVPAGIRHSAPAPASQPAQSGGTCACSGSGRHPTRTRQCARHGPHRRDRIARALAGVGVEPSARGGRWRFQPHRGTCVHLAFGRIAVGSGRVVVHRAVG